MPKSIFGNTNVNSEILRNPPSLGFTATTTGNTYFFSGESPNEIFRITQAGTGNSFIVEDSTNPDSSPFVIDASGNTGIGLLVPSQKLHVSGNTLINGDITVTGNRTNLRSFTGISGSMSTSFNSPSISATTYLNLPTDVFVTGGTYSAGTLTFTNNTGGAFNVTSVATGSIYTDTDNYTSGVTKTITHNLNTTNIVTQIIDTNTNELIYGSVDNYQTNSVDITLNQTLTNIKVIIIGTSYFEGSNNLPSCEIRIQGNSGLSNTNNGSDFLVLFNTTTYNSSPTTFQITNSKIQLLKPGRYMIKGRYSSFDILDGTDFLRVAVISATTSSNGDLGTKLEYLDQGYIGTTGNGEASKAGSMVLNASGNEWIGLVALHGGASGGSGTQGYPVFNNDLFNQPYLEIIRLGN